jgi:hypothetical protein
MVSRPRVVWTGLLRNVRKNAIEVIPSLGSNCCKPEVVVADAGRFAQFLVVGYSLFVCSLREQVISTACCGARAAPLSGPIDQSAF